ncbi:MAG: tryptophan synthase subunit alpha [Candidatus Coatesbacteria bacterium]
MVLESYFRATGTGRRGAFMPYVTAGYPSAGAMPGILGMLAGSGADCVEIGVPFSDPVADGVTIQRASEVALARGGGLAGALRAVQTAARMGLRPVLMSYANPLWQAGLPALARRLADAGAQGVIVPDLPLELAGSWSAAFAEQGLALVLFAAPTTPAARLRQAGRNTRGFLYYVSLAGVTGERRSLPRGLAARLRTVRRIARSPVCVGFGVSTPRQAAAVARVADGVIVGAAVVRRLEGWGRGVEKRRAIARWTASMARAVHGAAYSR